MESCLTLTLLSSVVTIITASKYNQGQMKFYIYFFKIKHSVNLYILISILNGFMCDYAVI